MFKERLGTKILLPIFTFLMSLTLIAVIFFGSLLFVVSKPEVVLKSVLTDKVLDETLDKVYDDIDIKEFTGPIDLNGYSIDASEIIEGVLTKDFFRFFIFETFEAVLYSDAEYDHKAFEAWIDDTNDFLKDKGMENVELNQFNDEFEEYISKYFDELAEKSKEQWEDIDSSVGVQIKSYLLDQFIFSVVINVIFLVVLLIVAKNKFLTIKYFGISLAIADLHILGLVIVLQMIVQESLRNAGFDKFINIILDTLFRNIYFVVAGIFMLGIVLIVLGVVLSIIYVKSVNRKSEDLYSKSDDLDSEFGF